MTVLAPDPMVHGGLAEFAARFRRREITARSTAEIYLDRIAALNPKLDAYIHVAGDSALEAASGIDRLLAAGTDLGPLMGVPVAIKDLFAVTGMPTRAGSNLDLTDCIGPEGGFVKALKRAGCVILGKTRTIEFAAGGQNVIHPTPWNPSDLETKRTPGGSSHGSAVAMAAGLCGFAVGSDTGGSVRAPAALCGVFGLKTTYGLWPLDGIFPLCPSMDTVGILTRSAADAALVYTALCGNRPSPLPSLSGVRLGLPDTYFFDDLDPEVASCSETALSLLEEEGARLVPVAFPEAEEIIEVFSGLVSANLLATLGRDRFLASRESIDPVAVNRLMTAFDLPATEYIRLSRRREYLARICGERLAGLDGLLCPTAPLLPRLVSECSTTETASDFTARSLRNTRPANVCNQCAASIPIHALGSRLPVALQVSMSPNREKRLLAMAMAIEERIGQTA